MTGLKRLLPALAMCGILAVGAHAATEVVYQGDYATVTVTTEEKTVTYTDANGVQQTYTYTVTSSPTVNVDVSGLTYDSPNGNTYVRYYAWNDDGTLTQVNDANSADVTVSYNSSSSHQCTSSDSTGSSISMDIIDKTTSDENGGGAVHARGGRSGSYSGTIGYGNVTGNMIGNHGTSGSGSSYQPYIGGAISVSVTNDATYGVLGNITGNFIGNYYSKEDGAVYGGAIGNYVSGSSGNTATIGDITGSFVGNYVEATGYASYGGAIANNSAASGTTATIGDIEGDFIGNYATGSSTAYGGAISNNATGTAKIGKITGSFVNNYVETTGSSAVYGGAIYNNAASSGKATIDSISADFIANTATSSGSAYGGAIYNNTASSGTATIDSITADFIANTATSSGNSAYGGAICNYVSAANGKATIGDITGSFVSNYAEATGTYAAFGGAIFNYATGSGSTATIDSITGDFIANYVSATNSGSMTYGGAISNMTGSYGKSEIGDITGDFIGNYVETNNGGFGGAISNEASGSSSTATVGDITGDFIGNYTTTTGGYDNSSAGGAISNRAYGSTSTATIGKIKGDFIGNHTDDGNGYGGAIMNRTSNNNATATIESIEGSFIGNYVASSASYAYGGAIYNYVSSSSSSAEIGDITADFIGNYAKSTVGNDYGEAYGGAIFNDGSTGGTAEIGAIKGDFIGNYAESSAIYAYGGAVYNKSGTIGDMTGDFIGNYAMSSSNYAIGGAIYNTGTIGAITGDFISNYASTTSGDVTGGAVYNTGEITGISGDLIGNYASTTSGEAMGGAIYNTGAIGTFEVGDISGNSATGTTGAYGGAIYDSASTIAITGDVIGNSATADGGEAYGGAIYVGENTTVNLSGNITGNSATGDEAYGGAIYNEGTLDLDVDAVTYNSVTASSGDAMGGAIYDSSDSESTITVTGDVVGNSATADGGEAYGGAIYVGGNTTVNLSGNITGNSATGSDAKGGAIYNTGTVNFDISEDTVIYGNTANGEENFLYATEDSVTNFKLTDASLIVADGVQGEAGYEVNVTGNGIDATTFYMFKSFEDSNFSIGNTTLNTIDGVATVYNVNQLGITDNFEMVADVDVENREMDRFVTNENSYEISEGTTLTITGLNAASDSYDKNIAVYFAETGLMNSVVSTVTEFSSPVNTYEAFYVRKDGNTIYYNDETYDISKSGSSLVFNSSDEDGGYFVINRTGINPAIMVTPMSLMGALNAMNMSFGYSFEHSDYFMKLPSETRLEIMEWEKAKKSKKQPKETDATKPAYYNQNEMTMRGAWVKTYASNDNVSYKHGWESRDKMYGAIVGFDSNMHEYGNGWASVFSGYVGTLGIRQEYDAGHVKQHGGLFGLTESFYKKNFYNAWILAAGRLRTHEHTENGHDSSSNDTWGIATKFGWNIELADGKYTLLPTVAASYTTVSLDNYTNAAEVYMSGSGVRALQINPNVKFIMNGENGFQPYLTVGEVWTVSQSSSVRADGLKLEELKLKPYTEYGLGVQKRWASDREAYVQLLAHSGGSDGFVFNAGLRWNF